MGMKKSSPLPDPSDLCDAVELRLLYLVVGKVRFSAWCELLPSMVDDLRATLIPRLCSSGAGTTFSLCPLFDEFDLEVGGRLGWAGDCAGGVRLCEFDLGAEGRFCDMRGSSVGVSE